MRIIPINNSPKFKGYSNVLHAVCEDGCGRSVSYMSAHLDNIGKNDLQQWHKIQKKLLLKNKVKDTITFSIFRDEINNHKHLILDKFSFETVSKFDGSAIDKMLVEAMLFIQSLTDRIKSATSIKSDNQFNETLNDTTELLTEIFDNKIGARLYTIEGIKPDFLISDAAKKMNEDIIDEISKIY